ncbi:MAG: hypothetical protein IIU80_04815 [Clostridia bacterium]|nr:hypothetical protein [Clostridia bacterium]
MKKIISIFLAVVICFAFASCGKSEEVKAVEAKIATLTENTSFKEINDIYELYSALTYDEQDKVENKDVLAQYISLDGGEFTLTDDMVDEIKEYFADDEYGLRGSTSLMVEIMTSKELKDYASDWDRLSNYNFTSAEKTDDYTYTKYGIVKILTKFGRVASYEFEMNCTMEYDAENDELKISTSADIFNR